MPDATGVLSQDERDRIAAAMRAKGFNAACPWCGNASWEIGPSIVSSVPVDAAGAMVGTGRLVPQVMLISPCGYIANFAAKLVGLVM